MANASQGTNNVGTNATPLTADPASGTDAIAGNTYAITWVSGNQVFLGGSDVDSASKGSRILGTVAPATVFIDLAPGEILYGCTASGTASVDIIRVK